MTRVRCGHLSVIVFLGGLIWMMISFPPQTVVAKSSAITITLPASVVTSTGLPVTWRDWSLHIAPHTLSANTQLQLNTATVIDSINDSGTPHLPWWGTVRSPILEYRFDHELQQGVVVRLAIDFDDFGAHRKQIWYCAQECQHWHPLRTTMNKTEGYLQATIDQPTGYLVFATNRRFLEGPIKNIDFEPYPGTALSDTAAVLDVKSGQWLYRQEATKQRHIASITKLMTVALFLQTNPDIDQIVSYQSNADRIGALVDISGGDQLSLHDVLMGTLMPSANNMAVTLAQHSGIGWTEFIAAMNAQATQWGLYRTHFTDPTGLDVTDVSTAGNVARLARFVFTTYPEVFAEAAGQDQYLFSLRNSGALRLLESTNKFDGHGRYRALAFKTGYYPGTAERTLVIEVEEISTGHQIIVVLLGDPIYDTINAEAEDLAAWTFANWNFHNY